MNNVQSPRCKLFIRVSFPVLALALCTHAFAGEAVIGQYAVTNEEQCRRLCWYRRSCKTYSYYVKSAKSITAGSSASQNCILRDEFSVKQSAHDDADWIERPASNLHVHNGCNNRPCSYTDVCVPMPSNFACLPLTTRCIGTPQAVTHGDVITINISNGESLVRCHAGYVASPRDVPLRIKCSGAEGWTPFAGTCMQFEFRLDGSAATVSYNLPWKLAENSELCIKGVVHNQTILRIRLVSYDGSVKLCLYFPYHRTGMRISWAIIEEDQWGTKRPLGNTNLIHGDSFNVTVRLLRFQIEVVINEASSFQISLNEILLRNGSLYDVRKSNSVRFPNAGHITYANLISGC